MVTIEPGADRIAQLDAEIAWLYGEVQRLEGKCKSLLDRRGKDGGLYFMLDLQSKSLRERWKLAREWKQCGNIEPWNGLSGLGEER